MFRKTILLLAALLLVALGVLALLVYQASPGPTDQAILGVALGNHETGIDYVFLSGRRLDCQPADAAPFTDTCTIDIAGDTLTISAHRYTADAPNFQSGSCEATYRGKSWPCQWGSRHVHIHWFTYITDPLGLDAGELDALRTRYPIENLPEAPFFTALIGLPILMTALVIVIIVAWRWPAIRPGTAAAALIALAALPLATAVFGVLGALVVTGLVMAAILIVLIWPAAGQRPAVRGASLLTGIGLVTYVATTIFAFWLTNPFWD